MNYKRVLGTATAALLIIIAVFMLAPAAGAQSYKTLYKFRGGNYGGGPGGGLIFDKARNLYGVAGGGAYGAGVVFRLTQNAKGVWVEKVLHEFTGGADGGGPNGNLIFDAAGNLYGTTLYGGGNSSEYGCWNVSCGVVFRLAPNSKGVWIEKVLYNFCSLTNCTDGASPMAGLIFDAAGNLYGTTAYGGGRKYCSENLDGSCGVVFELTPKANGRWKEKVLYHFKGSKVGADGGNPMAGLIFDQVGNLYGTTSAGGLGYYCPAAHGCGTVFKLTPNSDGKWTESVLYAFTLGSDGGSNGFGSVSGLILDAVGNLYGTTPQGGYISGFYSVCEEGCGVVFELTPNADGGWTESVLFEFCPLKNCSDGLAPQAGVILDAAGNLYGTTPQGGNPNYCINADGCGVVFELTPANGTWAESVLHSFTDGKDGGVPSSGLTFDAVGNLYGEASGGGTGNGVVFEITP